MGELPVLSEAGVVRFSSREELASSWDKTLGRGVLIVRPEGSLAALQQLDVAVEGLDAPLRLQVEVVHLEPGVRAMLRLLAGPQAKPSWSSTPLPLPPTPPLPKTPTSELPAPLQLPQTSTPLPVMMPAPSARSPAVATSVTLPSNPTIPGTVHTPANPFAIPRLVDAGETTEVPRASSQTFLKPMSPPSPSRSFGAASAALSGGAQTAASSTGVIDVGPLVGAPAAVASTLPPYFGGDVLRFHTVNDLRGGRGDLMSLGAVLAVCDERAPAHPVEVRIAVGSQESRSRLRCMLSAAQPGTVVLQVEDKLKIAQVFDELDPPVTGDVRTPAEGSRAVGKALTLPTKGRLWNPMTPKELMKIAAHRPVLDDDLARPSVPLLLRWLRTTRGVLRVELSTAGQPVHSLIVVDGREVRSPVSLQTLGRAVGAGVYDYVVTEIPKAPQLSHTGRTLHLIVEALRALISAHEPEALALAFPHTKETRLVRAVSSVVDALGFSGPHARLIKSSLSGDDVIENVVRGAAGARVAWDVLIVLELFGGLSFVVGEPRRPTPTSMSGVGAMMNEVNPLALLAKDHFAVLGLHWSSSPTEIGPAFQRTRADHQPGALKRPASASDAEQLLRRIDEAYLVLNDVEARRAYRRATFNMVWPHQAQIMVAQAKLALYRKDLLEARNLLLAAQDVSPSTEAAELLALLNSPKKS